jgi:hypothetical protein
MQLHIGARRQLGAYLSMTTAGVLDAIFAVFTVADGERGVAQEGSPKEKRGRELDVVGSSEGLAETWCALQGAASR